jgi:hypothetical protein
MASTVAASPLSMAAKSRSATSATTSAVTVGMWTLLALS